MKLPSPALLAKAFREELVAAEAGAQYAGTAKKPGKKKRALEG